MQSTVKLSGRSPSFSHMAITSPPTNMRTSSPFTSTFLLIAMAAFILYTTLCSLVRFRFERAMRRKFAKRGYNPDDRATLAGMTNDDAQEILSHVIQWEMPWMYQTALQFAIFKTYGIETISRTIVQAKSFSDPKTAPKRYEDTAIIFGEFSLNKPASPRAIKAVSRMNFLHSAYIKSGHISNADLLYTLSMTALEPIRFIGRFDWRPLNAMERAAFGTFWKGIGDAMDIDYAPLSKTQWRDGLDFLDDLDRWSHAYEVEHMKPARVNLAPSRALVDMLIHLCPGALRPFAIEMLTVLMGDRLREAVLYPEPSVAACLTAYGSLALRKLVMRFLALPRMTPYTMICEGKDGKLEHLEYLVDPWYVKPSLRRRWGLAAWWKWLFGGRLPDGEERFLPGGFTVEDLGPTRTMGKGGDVMAAWERRLETERSGRGCPFFLVGSKQQVAVDGGSRSG